MPSDSLSGGRYRGTWQALVDARQAFESCSYLCQNEIESGLVLADIALLFAQRVTEYLEYLATQIVEDAEEEAA